MGDAGVQLGSASSGPQHGRGGVLYGAAAALGVLLFWLSNAYPARMPVWAPWDFSPTVYLATALALAWFWRGLALSPAEVRPPVWRCVALLCGIALIYAVLQTRFEYWSQHMFFLNRAQHVMMHHIGPFLVALGGAGPTIRRGMPRWTQRLIDSRPILAIVRIIQQPLFAAFLFVGLFYFWLIPSIHFRAMIDPRLYAVMNWSMVIDGVLFWCLVLDPRPRPPARVSYGMRVALSFGVMFPQILLGAIITFAQRDLYPYYDLCGRLFPSIDAVADQHIGGIVMWIPPSMMSVIGVIAVLNALRIHEDAKPQTVEAAAMSALASRWTGR